MGNPRYSESVVVGRSPEDLYDMISDVTRMGEWSPVCRACWWDDGDGPRAGAWFTGRNELPERTWETRSEVVAADRGREFAFVVGGAWVRWGYTFTPVDGGTQVTESWEFLPDGITRFHDRYGDDAENQIAERTEAARRGIPLTLPPSSAPPRQAADRVDVPSGTSLRCPGCQWLVSAVGRAGSAYRPVDFGITGPWVRSGEAPPLGYGCDVLHRLVCTLSQPCPFRAAGRAPALLPAGRHGGRGAGRRVPYRVSGGTALITWSSSAARSRHCSAVSPAARRRRMASR